MTYRWLYILAVFIGPYMTVAAVWNIADIFNALMALPNLIALLVLSNVVVKETKDYFCEDEIERNQQNPLDLFYDSSYNKETYERNVDEE